MVQKNGNYGSRLCKYFFVNRTLPPDKRIQKSVCERIVDSKFTVSPLISITTKLTEKKNKKNEKNENC